LLEDIAQAAHGFYLPLSGAKTIETHRAAAMRKLKLTSTAALVRYAIRIGLISAEK